jgi:uncharacterized protein (TIGR02246 family)
MKKLLLIILVSTSFSCKKEVSTTTNQESRNADSLKLVKMITEREKAMINKDINIAMSQFTEDVTWINSQGYYFQGKSEVLKFHNMLAENDSLDYYYKAGIPRIRIIDFDNAIAYYSWKMFWYKKEAPTDTIKKEIGLMTLTAKKNKDNWKWIAITNQHTPWFYDEIEPVFID